MEGLPKGFGPCFEYAGEAWSVCVANRCARVSTLK